jgi:AraC-like DNA-binding protein
MNAKRPFTAEVERTTTALVRAGATTRIEDVAAALYVSRATLQRHLAREGESFTEIRKRLRVTVAITELSHGASCAGTAARVGLSGEHLCRLVSQRTGLRPKEIVRASSLAARAQRWRRLKPPRSGSRLYWERSRRWRALEAEVRMLLEPVPTTGHPLSNWARRTIHKCTRPDYRSGHYRAQVHAARSAERRAREAERRRLDAWLRTLHRSFDQDMLMIEALSTSDFARDDALRSAPG